MTWYDGGPAPEPAPWRARGRHVAGVEGATGSLTATGRPPGAYPGAPDPGLRGPAARWRADTRAHVEHPEDGGADEEPWNGDGSRVLGSVRWRVAPRVAAAAVVVLAVVGGAVALRAASAPSAPAVVLPEPSATAPQPTVSTPAGVVWVHVVGQVAAPGLVELPVGSRVADAVAAAGGALPDADLGVVNLAALVVDGAQVRVPAPGEPAPPAEQAGARADPVGAGTGGQGTGGRIDLNTATAGELEALPGIGPVLAERIVAWRTEHGAFADVEALEDVPGIGPALLAGLRDQARV